MVPYERGTPVLNPHVAVLKVTTNQVDYHGCLKSPRSQQQGELPQNTKLEPYHATWWSSKGSLPRISEGCVIKFAPHKAPKLIAPGKLTFDERVELNRVEPSTPTELCEVPLAALGGGGCFF